MSCFEREWGNGKITKADIKKFKSLLCSAFEYDYHKYKPRNVKAPNTRQNDFPLFTKDGFIVGGLKLNIEDGTFNFDIYENNNNVEYVKEGSVIYKTMIKFLKNIPTNGKVYGAHVFYESEYTRDAAKLSGISIKKTSYGAWK